MAQLKAVSSSSSLNLLVHVPKRVTLYLLQRSQLCFKRKSEVQGDAVVSNRGNALRVHCNKGIQVVASSDKITESIDVDQIVMEHYQATCTPQPAISKFPLITPTADQNSFIRPEEISVPPELCSNCSHGFKLGLCPEAAKHLQEMKDMLIAVSNDLLDNAAELSQAQIDKLRQDRSQLNKQIQQLEKYLRDKERQKSHCSASTLVRNLQYETPQSAPCKIDPMRFDAQVHLRNDLNGYEKWNAPSVSFSSIDSFGVSSVPLEREPYIPSFVEVNYIEGSNDPKLSSTNFPWTKKLEANNKKVFGNHSFRPNQRKLINATMSGYDVFVLMPTGGGKSLTYQLPALVCPGITLVISPLVSLIQDQTMHLLQAKIPAAYLSANMEWTEQQEILRELCSDYCKYKLLYVTPEKNGFIQCKIVKKSDIYRSVSSVLKVNESKAHKLCSGGQRIVLRFPSSVKASKQGKSEATPAKGSLMSGKLSPPQACSPAQPQSEVDLNLSAKLFSALRMLRTALLKEAGDGVMAYHIFG
ncbi:hypothetical protein NC651_007720 [Populus alba x Populus x berolinensis]|nr:hypothetical protein NC651_007720 [Populus alba x Populus x berolinensis]